MKDRDRLPQYHDAHVEEPFEVKLEDCLKKKDFAIEFPHPLPMFLTGMLCGYVVAVLTAVLFVYVIY